MPQQRSRIRGWFSAATLALAARGRLCSDRGVLFARTPSGWLPACDGLVDTVAVMERAGLVVAQDGPVVVTDAGRVALVRTRAVRRVLAV